MAGPQVNESPSEGHHKDTTLPKDDDGEVVVESVDNGDGTRTTNPNSTWFVHGVKQEVNRKIEVETVGVIDADV